MVGLALTIGATLPRFFLFLNQVNYVIVYVAIC